MKTIKLPVTFNEKIEEDIRVYSSVVRYSFNRFQEGLKIKEIYHDCSEKFNLGSHLLNCANREAQSLFKREGLKKVIFGDFKKRIKGLISNNDFKNSKSRGFTSEGECPQKGNRHFEFDILNNTIIYKRNKKEHISLSLPNLKKKIKDELLKVQFLMESKSISVTIKLKNGYIFITFDESIVHESLKLKDLKSNRVMGIDLNPNYIGFSILEFNEDDSFSVLKKGVFDVTLLNKDFKKNKKRHELRELNHKLIKICKHYKVSKICVEDLSIKSSDKGQGKTFNRLCNNQWNRDVTLNNLKILTSTYGIELVEVNPIYSSFVGNIEYGDENTPDMVASSIEIARRGYKKFLKGWFYPNLNLSNVRNKFNQWKEEIYSNIENWKNLFDKVKKSGMRYRFQLSECDAVFERFYHKMNIKINFYI